MKVVHTSGKRKRSIARATVKEGKGVVRINSQLLEHYGTPLARMKIQEPLLLATEWANKVNIEVKVKGGGIMSGADAVRLSIAKGLVEFSGKSSVKQQFLEYDRNLLIADVRRGEASKPGDSKPRAKRQKSYR